MVDTSVWIRALAGREPYRSGLDRLLDREDVIGHDFVFGELLMGDRGGRSAFLARYEKLPNAKTVAHDHVVQLVRSNRLHGRGAGWIDLHLLAAALSGGHELWTADPRLLTMAVEFRVAYQTSA